MNPFRVQVPWKGVLVPPMLHLVFVGAWGWISGYGLLPAAWQLMAWPLLCAMALISMSPVLYFVLRRRAAPNANPLLLLAMGVLLSVSASFALTTQSLDMAANAGVAWLLALCASGAFELYLGRTRRVVEASAHPC
jgi:hypothetical protein